MWKRCTGRSGRRVLLVTGVLGLALGLRLWGVDHGLPQSYYPDEAHLVKRALSFGSGDLNPHWFHKPALYMYLLFFEYGAWYCWGRMWGMWGGTEEFGASFISDPGPFYLLGRLLTVAFSVGTVVLAYRIGERHLGRNAGLLGALLLALAAGHIASAQDIKEDTAATFFALASMAALLAHLRSGRQGSLLLAAALAGLGTAVKTYPVVMLVPIAAAAVMGARRKSMHAGPALDAASPSATPVSGPPARPPEASRTRPVLHAARRLALVAGVFGLLFFVSSPYSLLDPLGRKFTFVWLEKAWASITGTADPNQITHDNLPQVGMAGGAWRYLENLLAISGMGPVIGLVSLAGAAALIRRGWPMLLFLSFPACFLLASVVVAPGYAEARHQLPVYPFLALGGGAVLAALLERRGRAPRLAAAAALVLLLHPLALGSSRAREISREDTRNVAEAWIESHLPAGTAILLDENGPQLLPSPEEIDRLREQASATRGGGQFTTHYGKYLDLLRRAARDSVTYRIFELRLPWWRRTEAEEGEHVLAGEYDEDMGNPLKRVGVEDYEHYLQQGYQYAVVVSERYERFIGDADGLSPRKYPSFARFYRRLFDRAEMVREFAPGDELTGPVVRVMRLR